MKQAEWIVLVAWIGILTASGLARPPEPATRQPGEASPSPGMTLAELEETALAYNPTLVQGAMRVRAAEGNCLQSGLYPNPVIAYRGEEIGDERTAGFQGGTVSQELITAGKLRLNRAVASEEIRQAQWVYQAQRLRVLNDVRTAFYDGLAAQQTIEVYEQLLRISEEGLKVADRLLAGKEASRVDVLQARVEARSVALQWQNARNQQTAVWRRLAAVVGRPDLETASLAGRLDEDIPSLTWEEARDRLLAESPLLAEAQAGVRRAECALERQRAERVPNLQLQAGVSHDNQTGFDTASAGIGLPLPVFNRNQGNIRRAQAELAAAQKEVDRVRLELQQRLATVFGQFENSRQQAEKYAKEILPDARESLELVRKGYRAGELNYVTLLTAQRTYFQVSLNAIESLRTLRASSVAIEGMLLSGGLNAGAGSASGTPADAVAVPGGG